MNRGLRWLLPACLTLLALPTQAQDYGTGITVPVPMADPAVMVMDGEANEAAWANAATVDILNQIDFYGPDGNVSDYTGSTTKILYSQDTLYLYVELEDNGFFWGYDGNPWTGDQILVGIDATHAGDEMTDDSYAGWPANAPAAGPTTYKITHPDSGGITLNWGYDGVDPEEEGWVNGTVFSNEETLVWGVEAAFYVPGMQPGGEIGFNIGGSQASLAQYEASGGGEAEGNYGYYSWQIGTGPFGAGGAVMADGSSFSTLELVAPSTEYGTGIVVDVPPADPSVMVMDGEADEAAWASAATVDILNEIDFYGPDGNVSDYTGSTTKILYSQDTLYLYVELEDNGFFWGYDGNPWTGDQILVGIDATHAGDEMTDDSYAGWPANAPAAGPTTYKITHPDSGGITLNWGYDGVDPEEEGWVNGTVFSNEETLVWGVEAALYVPTIEPGSMIGFNIGGSQASLAQYEASGGGEAEGNYGYYSWQIGTGPFGAGGAVMADGSSFSTLHFTGTVGIEDRPDRGGVSGFALRQNSPNPFRSSTSIEYELSKPGRVQLFVYNTLGQRVASVEQGMKSAGFHPVTLDAGDLAGGVYMYQLVVDGKAVASRKMIVVR